MPPVVAMACVVWAEATAGTDSEPARIATTRTTDRPFTARPYGQRRA